ncbi:MAG: UxaA family hydrolase [Deltaproteobacteria bacterium]|uniref:UxaA family hydrolase n=1 Tax=Candidatus Zymogenus saltonus TaxID=2844893 RepID=A0A9D8PR26_9DELT|nr:UxaA family hydrolase [Candidatus Zymogenus saltonus]
MKEFTFMGYRRENGRVGVRNHVLILPLDDISNAAAEAVANNVKGTLAVPHGYGRLQFGEDLELFFRTMIGTGRNPNVAAVVVIGIEEGWTKRLVNGIAETGKPACGFSIERHGDLKTIEAASRKALEYVKDATELQRTECGASELYVSIKCGESDTTSGLASNPSVGEAVTTLLDMGGTVSFGETSEITGAEMVVVERAATKEVGEEFYRVWKAYDDFINEVKTDDLSDSQPTKGNIAGGLTTIEEKAFGNIQKIGKTARYIGVLKPAEEPRGKGLWYMDTSSAAAEAVTLWMASGAVIHLFPTGQGNVIGNPVTPVIKLSANPITVETMSEHIDLDVSDILKGSLSLTKAGEILVDLTRRTANGRLTAAEVLGHREFVLTKLYRSA